LVENCASGHLSSLKIAVKHKESGFSGTSLPLPIFKRKETTRLHKCRSMKKEAQKKLSDFSAHGEADGEANGAEIQKEEFNLQKASHEKRLVLLEAVYRSLLRCVCRQSPVTDSQSLGILLKEA
jgi:hypothetical protein